MRLGHERLFVNLLQDALHHPMHYVQHRAVVQPVQRLDAPNVAPKSTFTDDTISYLHQSHDVLYAANLRMTGSARDCVHRRRSLVHITGSNRSIFLCPMLVPLMSSRHWLFAQPAA